MSRQAFESWCETILKDNPNWRESGDAELGRQAYQTATNAALERAAEVCAESCNECAKEIRAFGWAKERRKRETQ